MAVFQDSGNAETEALLIDTEYEIQEIYDRAAKETQKKLEDYLDGFQRRDAQKQALVNVGKMSESEYATWRKNQMLTGQRWKDMVNTLTEDHVNADKIAMSVVRGHLPDAYAINANYGTYEIEKGTSLDTMFTLYDRQSVERLVREKPDLLPPAKVDIPADKRWNKQHIRNEITQSILQGDSMPNVAKRLQRVTDMDHRAAVRNARTAITGAQNGGRVNSYKRAEAMGIKLKQQWLATLDNRTRHEHRQLDGQSVKVGESFKVGHEEIRFPGDPQAAPHLVYNCRCTLIADLEGFENDPKDMSLRYDDRLEGMSYEEWKGYGSRSADGYEKVVTDIRNEIAKQNTIPTEEQLKRAGKALANDFDEFRKGKEEEVKRSIPKIKEEIETAEKKAEEIDGKIEAFRTDYFDGKITGAEYYEKTKPLRKEYAEAADKVYELKRQLRKAEKGGIPQEESVDWLKNKLSLVRDMGSNGIDVVEHLNRSRSPVRGNIEYAYSQYPKSWVQASVDYGTLSVKKVDRGYYWHYNSEIAISGEGGNHSNSTSIHELGHRFEHTVPGIMEAERDFYARRTQGINLEWLGPGYKKTEVTRRDDFISPYMGKDYGGNGYELVSMGFQYAYTDPVKLAQDPDMQQWIYGLLSLV